MFVAGMGLLLPTATRAAEPCRIGTVADLPVTMRGMAPTVPVKINGRDARMIVDSGANISIVSAAAAAELDMHDVPRQRGFDAPYSASGIGGTVELKTAIARTFSLADATVKNVEMLVGGSDFGVAGLLGRNVLSFVDVEYDLAHGAVRIVKPLDCGKFNIAYWARDRPVSILSIADDAKEEGAIATVFLNGVPIRALFDSGASTSVMTLGAVARAGVHVGDAGVVAAGMGSGIGRGLSRNWIGRFQTFKVGDEEIRNTRIRFGEISGLGIDMLLGADFFLSHRIMVANSQRRLYFTYEGGPVFRLDDRPKAPQVAAAAATAGEAASAAATTSGASAKPDDLARVASAKYARRDFEGALADLDKAIDAMPEEPRYRVQRARTLARLDRNEKAVADLDKAIAIESKNAEARIERAAMLFTLDRWDAARADLDAASAALARSSDLRSALGGWYTGIGAFGAAVEQFDIWIATHGSDSGVPEVRNSRCWARALGGRELPKALDDCNAAVRANPRSAGALDSRGLVRLRMGSLPEAIADYDAALAIDGSKVWSRFGRGLALVRSGRSDGRDDIAAAAAASPKLIDRARRYGMIPAEGEPR